MFHLIALENFKTNIGYKIQIKELINKYKLLYVK